ncbi:restriction endonuclease subunit S [Aquihabitans sp. G128]|uniref:restriction endonuclease subunit S n=1 Tax=Aquihabitans sp. G128 TaxID=2849779 RepID=UPI001C228155|nr:restriction endonuclease subunit S [Aquihabitans sp. G128]QXC62346.1 restriction endonuclease subunit S [Aquihabitans sp. G128]
MSDDTYASLGEVLELVIDRRGITPSKLGGQWTTAGVPVISAVHVKRGRVLDDVHRFVDRRTYERWMPTPLRAGDVLLTSEAPLGEVAFVNNDLEAGLGQRLFGLRGQESALDGRYLYYALRSDPVQSQLRGRATGTTVSGIRQSELLKVKIRLPPLHRQQAIGRMLGTLDDRIDSDLRLATLAEQLLTALIGAALPDTPTVTLSALVSVSRDMVDPANWGSMEVDHFSIPAFDTDRLPARSAGAEIKSGKFALTQPSILLSRLNPKTPRLWHAVPNNEVAAVCSTEFLVLTPQDGATLADVWLACCDPVFLEVMQGRVTGTSGSHQRVRPDDVLSLEVVDARHLSEQLRAEATDLLHLAHHRRTEARALGVLRDVLLPELLSGRFLAPAGMNHEEESE